MRISELREVARSRGLKGWTALRKNDLREFLINNGVRKPSTSKPKRLSVAERFAKQDLQEIRGGKQRTKTATNSPNPSPTISTNTLRATNTVSTNPKT